MIRCAAALVLSCFAFTAAAAQAPTTPPEPDTAATAARANPFADFETHHLSNGLKVWFKRLEGAADVSINVTVPYGSDLDPPGKRQLAHFTEHMLFGPHDGLTEEEIKDQVEARGGLRNGTTWPDRTAYYVTIANEHGLFALEWLSRIVSPHSMAPDIVEQGRLPVAVEIGASPSDRRDGRSEDLRWPWSPRPSMWKREFGMETRKSARDAWKELQAITSEDLLGFYDRYYAPGAMTLTIVGDLDRDVTLALAERTFGRFEARDVPLSSYELSDPGRSRDEYVWTFRSNVRYTRRHKLFSPTETDELYMSFVEDLLFRRLNQRLRYGERKAAYTPQVSFVKRGPAAYLQIFSSITETEYDFAVQVVDEELQHLRRGDRDPAEFEEDRRAVIERLRSTNLTAGSVAAWARTWFYNPDVYTDFPDLIAFYEQLDQAELAAFASATFVPERERTLVTYAQPIHPALFVGLMLLLVLGTHRSVARLLTRPIDMRSIRYIARFKTPWVIRIVWIGMFGAAMIVPAILTVAFGEFMLRFDSYPAQVAAYVVLIVSAVSLVMGAMAFAPTKILVFPDHLRIKSLAYYSRSIAPGDIEDLSLRRFRGVWSLSMKKCVPLTFAFFKPGLFMKTKDGKSIFFRTRDTEELREVLEEWRGAGDTRAGDPTGGGDPEESGELGAQGLESGARVAESEAHD